MGSTTRAFGLALLTGLVATTLVGVGTAADRDVSATPAKPKPTRTAKPKPAKVARPTLVYVTLGAASDPLRLHSAIVGTAVKVGLTREMAIRAVTFFVDDQPGATNPYAVDRSAPFVLPRRGTAGKHPYAVGVHTLRADAELLSGRHVKLEAPYWVARIRDMEQDTDGATLAASISAIPPGPVLVRPAPQRTSFVVTGDLELTRPLVVIERASITGVVEFKPTSSGSKLINSSALGFNLYGADDIVLQGNTFDGLGKLWANQLWDNPASNTPDRFVIRNNTFRNYYVLPCCDTHSEALFIGYSTDGLIEGNTFTNNGTTAHIFFSFWGTAAYEQTGVPYPRNVCVRGNKFGPRAGAFSDISIREEIPTSANIKIQRDASSTNPAFYGRC